MGGGKEERWTLLSTSPPLVLYTHRRAPTAHSNASNSLSNRSSGSDAPPNSDRASRLPYDTAEDCPR